MVSEVDVSLFVLLNLNDILHKCYMYSKYENVFWAKWRYQYYRQGSTKQNSISNRNWLFISFEFERKIWTPPASTVYLCVMPPYICSRDHTRSLWTACMNPHHWLKRPLVLNRVRYSLLSGRFYKYYLTLYKPIWLILERIGKKNNEKALKATSNHSMTIWLTLLNRYSLLSGSL